MTYKQWYDAHGRKTNKILQKLQQQNYTKLEIIDYFLYENMVINEKNFCPLYEKSIKCHNLESLNCLFCGCPFIRFDDNNSYCSIDAKDGKVIKLSDNTSHQDCSNCTIPHKNSFIIKYFKYDWFEIMRDC